MVAAVGEGSRWNGLCKPVKGLHVAISCKRGHASVLEEKETESGWAEVGQRGGRRVAAVQRRMSVNGFCARARFMSGGAVEGAEASRDVGCELDGAQAEAGVRQLVPFLGLQSRQLCMGTLAATRVNPVHGSVSIYEVCMGAAKAAAGSLLKQREDQHASWARKGRLYWAVVAWVCE